MHCRTKLACAERPTSAPRLAGFYALPLQHDAQQHMPVRASRQQPIIKGWPSAGAWGAVLPTLQVRSALGPRGGPLRPPEPAAPLPPRSQSGRGLLSRTARQPHRPHSQCRLQLAHDSGYRLPRLGHVRRTSRQQGPPPATPTVPSCMHGLTPGVAFCCVCHSFKMQARPCPAGSTQTTAPPTCMQPRALSAVRVVPSHVCRCPQAQGCNVVARVQADRG